MLVTDVTRMEAGFICVAGIEEGTRERIRPMLPDSRRIPLDWVASRGGVVDLRRVLELGAAPRIGRVPEIEDVLTNDDRISVVGALSHERFLDVVRASAVRFAVCMTVFGS